MKQPENSTFRRSKEWYRIKNGRGSNRSWMTVQWQVKQNDEWAVQRARYMTLETISQMSDDPLISLPAVAR
ncbi:hypothetical protein [Mesorhizobium sp. M1406]|uniref:hypothetical protein n=1 Tax=Mesorhizobium sp. M1406 TaxID=2957099 RepID=UPI003337B103